MELRPDKQEDGSHSCPGVMKWRRELVEASQVYQSFPHQFPILPLHFSLHAQWNPTELVALPIPLGKPKEKRSKKKGHPVVLILFEISS
jgi:hypothetical protein